MYCTSVKGEGILFEEKSLHEISDMLHTDREKGLSEAEAARRLGEDGPNVLKEGRKKTCRRVFSGAAE